MVIQRIREIIDREKQRQARNRIKQADRTKEIKQAQERAKKEAEALRRQGKSLPEGSLQRAIRLRGTPTSRTISRGGRTTTSQSRTEFLRRQAQAEAERRIREENARRIEQERIRKIAEANRKIKEARQNALRKAKTFRAKELINRTFEISRRQNISLINAEAKIKRVEKGVATRSDLLLTTGTEVITREKTQKLREELGLPFQKRKEKKPTQKKQPTVTRKDFQVVSEIERKARSWLKRKIKSGLTPIAKLTKPLSDKLARELIKLSKKTQAREKLVAEKRAKKFEPSTKALQKKKRLTFDAKEGSLRLETNAEVRRREAGTPIVERLLTFSDLVGRKTLPKSTQKKLKELDPFIPQNIKKSLVLTLDSFIKFSAFSPLLVTGAAKKGKAKVKAKQKQTKKASPKKEKKLLTAAEEAFKRGELEKQLIKISDGVVKEKTKILKIRKINNLKTILKDLKRKDLIKGFILDENTGAIRLIGKGGQFSASRVPVTSPKSQLIIDVKAFYAPQINKGLLSTTGATATIVRKRIRIGNQIRGLRKDLNKAKSNARSKPTQSNKKKVLTITKTLTRTLQKQKQLQKQEQLQKESQLNKQELKLKQALKTTTTTKTVQRLKSQLKTVRILKGQIKTKQPKEPEPIILKLRRKKKTKKITTKGKARNSFDAIVLSGKRKVRLNKIPLSERDAEDLGGYGADNSTSRTFILIPRGKRSNLGKINKKIKGYFKKNRKKFRSVRIKKGKAFKLRKKKIEKRKHLIDTKGEKRGLSISKLKKQKFKVNSKRRKTTTIRRRKPQRKRIVVRKPVRRVKRKLTPAQKKILIKRLEKARRIKKRNLKKKR